MDSLIPKLIQFCASLLLLLSVSMLAQHRIRNLIRLLALQGLILAAQIALVAHTTKHYDLYFTVMLTLSLKVFLFPFVLHHLLERLKLQSKIEPISNLPSLFFIAIFLVMFGFNLGKTITQMSPHISSHTLSLAMASVLIASFMVIIKRKAISQIIGFLALENNIFFVGSSFIFGMPLMVELGIAFDTLITLLIFGIFFLRLHEYFETSDLSHLEKLQEK